MSSTAHKGVLESTNKKGEFIRNRSSFRETIEAGGKFPPEADRYHLYVSLACPWATRCLIVRRMKGLENIISHTVVDHYMGSNGWRFNEDVIHCTKDPIYGAQYMREVYLKSSPEYTGRITVPVLFDKQTKQIVNNESSEIIRIFNTAFNDFCETDEQRAVDIYPEKLREQIESVNEWIYPYINNGVYRSGFARSQEAYDEAVKQLFEHLEKVEEILSKQRYLVGNDLTEADIRLWVTLIRFDQVYHGHFKCNKKQIINYPNMWNYVRELYQIPAFKLSTDMQHIRDHYMASHETINPFRIVSVGPDLDFDAPHDRDEKFPLS